MVKYNFIPNSVPGLKEDFQLMANTYQEALKAVKVHIERQVLYMMHTSDIIPLHCSCDVCGAEYDGLEYIDGVGKKNKLFNQLHGHHVMVHGELKADGR